MVPVNCASIPENLMESELFGHVKGAFTGADKDKKGLFEIAEGGTLFLDEIGDIPVSLQPKLLRVLQEGEIRPVGGSKSKSVNVRVIAATSKDLETEMASGHFREDLFYRLNVVPIKLPPLRHRTEDIPQLCQFFINRV
jgi:transcriptional regulator with GAF, ATPase, and Fis domain